MFWIKKKLFQKVYFDKWYVLGNQGMLEKTEVGKKEENTKDVEQ